MTVLEPVRTGGSVTAPVRVTVAVPTFRRPDDLRAGLPLLLAQARDLAGDPSGRYAVDVLVVDNDPARSAEPVVAALGARYAAEPTPGIAAVRNRAIDESSGSRLLAFIDDDERPEPGWLARLVETWEASGAAAVCGRITAVFAGELDPWLRAGDFWARRSMPTGTRIDVAAAGSLLLDLAQVRASGVRFEAPIALGAGEDDMFSHALVEAGARMVWCDESVALDFVPPERMTRAWMRTRVWSHGNATVLMRLRLRSGWAGRLRVRADSIARGVLLVALGSLRWAFGTATRSLDHQARGWRAAVRGIGMISGAVGLVYEEYARGGPRLRWDRRPA